MGKIIEMNFDKRDKKKNEPLNLDVKSIEAIVNENARNIEELLKELKSWENNIYDK